MDNSIDNDPLGEKISSFVCLCSIIDKRFILIAVYHPSYQILFADAASRYLQELANVLDPDLLTLENKRELIKEMRETFHEVTGIAVISFEKLALEGALFGTTSLILERDKEQKTLISGNHDSIVDIRGPLEELDKITLSPELEGFLGYSPYDYNTTDVQYEEIRNEEELSLNDDDEETTNTMFSHTEDESEERPFAFEKSENIIKKGSNIIRGFFAKKVLSRSQKNNNLSGFDSSDAQPRTITFHRRPHFVDSVIDETRRKKLSIYGGLAIVGVILLVLIGTPLNRLGQEKKRVEEKLEVSRQFVSNINELSNLDSEAARAKFEEGKEMVLSLMTEDLAKDEASVLWASLQTYEKELFKENNVSPELFSDLSLQSQGFIGKMMSLSNGMIYILNVNGDAIVEVSESSKRSRILLGSGDIGDVNMIAGYPGRIFLLRNNKIYVFDANGRELADYEGGGGTIRSVVAYTGNLYTLEPDNSMIYKLQGKEEGGYTQANKWLREGIETNLANAREMSIDGTVWLLSGENDLYRLSLGNISTFYLPKVEPILSRIDLLYTNEELESLYLFDASKNRIVEVAKTGELKLQYLIPKEINIDSFVVSKESSKIYILSGSKIYGVSL